MTLEGTDIREIGDQLRDASESVRLKACDRIAKLTTGEDKAQARELLPRLKELYLTDGNPAVKFLAKKALSALGEDPEKVLRESQAAPVADAGGAAASRAALVREMPILWRCAQDFLRPAIDGLSRLIWVQDDRVLFQVSETFRKVGTELAAHPLLLAFEEEKARPEWAVAEAENESLFGDIRELIDLMGSRSSGVNPAMAAKMGNINAPEVVASFVDMLRSTNPVLKENGITVLADLKDPRTVDPLVRLLGGSDPELDERILRTLGRVAREDKALQVQILKTILGQFRPNEPEPKLASIVRLVGMVANARTLDFVKGCLKHGSPAVRHSGVHALQSFAVSSQERVSLLSPLLDDANDHVQGAILVALWGTSLHERVVELARRMNRSKTEVRESLAHALGNINAVGVVPSLVRLLKDPDSQVQRAAIKAVRSLSNREALEALAQHVSHEDINVKVYAIDAVGRHMLTRFNDVINELVNHPDQDLRVISATVLALGRLKLDTNLPVITRFLKHSDERVRANAVEALEALGEPRVVPLIQGAVMDSDARTRANACRALWKYGDVWVVDTVKAMIESDSAGYQSSGAFCLGEMADMVRIHSRLVTLPLLMMALRRNPRFREYQES